MSKTPVACSNCRKRKVRCDGMHPCHNCSESENSPYCEYIEPRTTLTGMLKRGTACIPCRGKKKKCNAARPWCNTCAIGNQQANCVYDANTKTSDLKSATSISRKASLQSLKRNMSEPQLHRAQSFGSYDSLLDGSVYMNSMGQSYDFAESSTSLAYLEELEYVNPVLEPTENNYFAIFSAHRLQLGVTYSPEKMRAIQLGDSAVHPSLIHFAHLWGCVLWQALYRKSRENDEGRFLLLAHEALQPNSTRQPDSVELLQAKILLSIYSLYRKKFNEQQQFYEQAAEIISKNQMHIISPWPLQEPTDSNLTEEALTVCWFMTLQDYARSGPGMPPDLTDRLNLEFTALIRDPSALDNNVWVARTAALYFHKKTRDHIARWATDSLVPDSADFLAEHWGIIDQIHFVLAELEPSMMLASFEKGEKFRALAFKVASIILLAAAAVMHHLMAPHHNESSRKAVDSCIQLVGLSFSFDHEDYIYLDQALVTCWATAGDILKEQIQRKNGTDGQVFADKLQILKLCQKKLKVNLPV